jgi:hypothetical protein
VAGTGYFPSKYVSELTVLGWSSEGATLLCVTLLRYETAALEALEATMNSKPFGIDLDWSSGDDSGYLLGV